MFGILIIEVSFWVEAAIKREEARASDTCKRRRAARGILQHLTPFHRDSLFYQVPIPRNAARG